MVLRVRIMLVGPNGVGKTAITTKYFRNEFITKYCKTLAIDFQGKRLKYNNDNIEFHLWDTSGNKKYHNIIKSWYPFFCGIIFVYDITNKKSFKKIKKYIEGCDNKNIHYFLLGNKKDLIEKRQVSYNEGQLLASNYGMTFMEFSTKDSNVNIIIENMLNMVIKKDLSKDLSKDKKHKTTNKENNKFRNCFCHII